MRRAKSQAAKPATVGASILPLKQRRAGRSAALSAPMNTGWAASIARPCAPGAMVVLASPSSSTAKARFKGCWPTRIMPVAGSAEAHTRYHARLRSFLPTATRAPPHSSAMPSGVSTSAKPAPEAASRRAITVCGPSSGSVGQISASTERRRWQLRVDGPLDQRIGAGPGMLLARGEAAVEQLGLVLELLRRAAGIGIAAHDAHQHGVVRSRSHARNLEADLFAGAYEMRSA
jgi:hypothetical protein